MISTRIALWITAIVFITAVGCNGPTTKPPPKPIYDEILHEIRIGSTVVDPMKVNLFSYNQETSVSFQLLERLSSKSFQDSLGVNILVRDQTWGWKKEIGTFDVFNNGTVSFENNEWGSLVTFSAAHPLSYLMVPLNWGELVPDYIIHPGDAVELQVKFLRAEFENSEEVMLFTDNYFTYCSNGILERQVGSDDLSSDGLIESVMIGQYVLTDDDINPIPLLEVNDITIDFNLQVNPFKFADLLNVQVVLNNVFADFSYIIDTDIMNENGQIYIVDYAEGIVRYVMPHSMTYITVNGVVQDPLALPGDVIQIQIDFIEAEDSQNNEFDIQRKKFRIFFMASPEVPQAP